MSNYNTQNPVPSTDPRDLDDNATVFDNLMNGAAAAYPDRRGVNRKSWAQMEIDAAALVSPNVAALAATTPAADKGIYYSASVPVTMLTYTLTPFVRGVGAAIDAPAFRTAISAMGLADTGAYAGSAAKLTTARNIALTGAGSWSVSFDGSGNVTGTLTLANSGVSAGTYGSVTVNAKGLVTAASTTTPIANGGTNAATALAAGTNLGTSTVGTNTDQLARSSMIQNEIANKRTWANYTPTITPASGTYTAASATGSSMSAFGIRHFRILATFTTKGTGANPTISLPVAALTGCSQMPFMACEVSINGKAGRGVINPALTGIVVLAYDGTDLVTGNGAIISIMGSYPEA